MFSICKQFIKVNEELFLLKRSFEESRVKSVELVKEWLKADIVFKKDGRLFFCDKVEELQTINEEQ